jgi:hypothetical protein
MIIISMLLALATPTAVDAQRAVKAELKDSDSAKFRGLKPLKGKDGRVNGYCGWVNAKNGYGGYAGESYFLYAGDGKVVILPPELSEPELCK